MILISGGSGASGGPIFEQLVARGEHFRVLSRDPQKADALRKPGVEVVQGDLSKTETLVKALAGVERALLVSSPVPRQVELEGNFISAAKRAGARQIVKFSAMTADAKSPARFPRIHGEVEQLIRDSGLAWTFLRPTFFMQNLLGLAEMVKGGTIYQPAGKSKAGFVDTRDIAAVAVAALTGAGHEGKAYEITGPELLDYDQIAAVFSKIIGKPVKYQDIAPSAARESLLKMGIPQWNVDGILELMEQMRDGAYAKVTTAVAEVGKKPPTTLEAFCRQNAGAFGS